MNAIKKLIISFLFGKPQVFKTYKNFNDASKNNNNYAEKDLIKVVVTKAKEFQNTGANERLVDSMALRTFFILNILQKSKNINILDFGGGAGTHYMVLKNYFKNSIDFNWHVVETKELAKEAIDQGLENKELKFFSDINQAIENLEEIDLIYANGSLCYTDNPTKYITDLLEIKAKYMYITRTPFNEESNENIVGLQVSKLSSNGKGSLPIGFKDREVYYPFTVLGMQEVENLFKKYGKIELKIIEDKNAYPTNKGNFNNFGYVINLN